MSRVILLSVALSVGCASAPVRIHAPSAEVRGPAPYSEKTEITGVGLISLFLLVAVLHVVVG